MSRPVTIVTGAGRGLGRALALELAARDARVAAFVRDKATAVQMTTDHDILGVTADVSDPVAVRAAFATVRGRFGPIDILVNNAAVYPRRDFLEETAESFMETVAINLGGYVACTREALEDMVLTGRGRILNVSSFADRAPLPASAAYSVTKGAGRIFTRALLADLGDRFPDIVIGDWIPGALATRLGPKDGTDPAQAARWGAVLALSRDPSLSGVLFDRDQEVPPVRSIRGRLRDRVLGRRQKKLRRLSGEPASWSH